MKTGSKPRRGIRRGAVLRESRHAEAAVTAAVRRPLEPLYVDADIFKAVKNVPAVGAG